MYDLGVDSGFTGNPINQMGSESTFTYEQYPWHKLIFEASGITVPKTANVYHLYLLNKRAEELDIPKRLLFRLVWQESRYDSTAISPKGAFGYMQLMSATYDYHATEMEYCGEHTPEMNIIMGTRVLSKHYHYWLRVLDDEELAWIYTLASYNAGKGWVIAYNGIPPFKETQDFIAFIQQ